MVEVEDVGVGEVFDEAQTDGDALEEEVAPVVG